MLYRRLYFLFPDAGHARGVTRELVQAGVDEQHIHAVARDGVDLASLPQATVRQRQDAAGRIEAVAWNTNLALFAAATVALLAALFLTTVWLAVGALVVMAATFLGAPGLRCGCRMYTWMNSARRSPTGRSCSWSMYRRSGSPKSRTWYIDAIPRQMSAVSAGQSKGLASERSNRETCSTRQSTQVKRSHA